MPQPPQLLATKFYIPPPRSNQVERPRLTNQLLEGLKGKLTLISAPAGYGKTTLLSDLLVKVDWSVTYLSLDEKDNDLRRFLAYFFGAFQNTGLPGISKELSGELSAQPVQVQSLLTTLLNDLNQHQGKVLFVLDDYHTIQKGEIHDILLFLLDYLPQNLHVIISTRTDPPLRLSQFRARGELHEIRANDLRFTQLESENFFNQGMELALSDEDINLLVKKTEGWIVGLQLAAISLKKQADRHNFLLAFAGDDRYVMDYLMDEVLADQAEDIQKFLLFTSSLDRFCALLCDSVIGWESGKSKQIIDTLDRANLFVVPLDNRREWYRYHHLFASLLQHRLRVRGQVPIAQLHLNASAWFEDRGQINDALQYAIQGNNLQRIAALVKNYNVWVALKHERMSFIRWVKSQSEGDLQQEPWLSITAAFALTDIGQFEEAESFLRLAERENHLEDRARANIAMVRASQGSMLGDSKRMVEYAREGLRLASPDDIGLQGLLTFLLSKGQFWTGNLPASENMMLQGYQKNLVVREYERAVLDLSEVATVQAVRGKIGKSLQTLKDALNLAEENQRTSGQATLSTAYIHISLTGIYLEMGDFKSASHHVKEGRRLSDLWGQPEIVSNSYTSLSRYLLLSGDIEGALDAIHEAEKLLVFEGGEAGWKVYFAACKARLHLLRGEISEAFGILDDVGINVSTTIEFEKKFGFRVFIKSLIEQGDFQTAIQIANQFVALCMEADAVLHAMKFLILKAKACSLAGDLLSSLDSLGKALDIAAEEGLLVQAFVEEGEEVARLLYQAATRNIQPEFCQKVLDKFAKPVKPVFDSTSSLVEPLSNRELEVLEHIASGDTNQEIAFSLSLSLYTVKSHARNIFGKLGVKSRTEAVAKARLLGLLSSD